MLSDSLGIAKLLNKNHRGFYLKYLSIITHLKVKKIVEVGVFKGKNAKVLHHLFQDASLYLVDPWSAEEDYLQSKTAVSKDQSVYNLAYQEVKKTFSNRSNVKIIKKKGIDALSLIPNNLDIVFLDANHSYSSFKQELSHWYPKIRSGGIISGHNYGQRNLGDVERVVKEVLGNNFLVGQDRVWAHIKD